MSLTYSAAVEQTITAGEQIHQIVNGTATTEVIVEDGSKVPSIRKALLDNFYFKDPIAWQVGQTENVFNQIRQFTDGSWWYAPSATAIAPISMGSTPVGDPLWRIYDFDAIGKLTPQIRESMRRSYAEAGYNLVDGSFEAGGMLVNSNDVLLHESTGKAFSGPAGPVADGTDPTLPGSGYVPRSDVVLRDELTSGGSTINDIANLPENFASSDYPAQNASVLRVVDKSLHVGNGDVVAPAAYRDAVLVSRGLNGLTDCHAFADRTIISGVTDSGTYGTFDATTKVIGSHAQSHLFAFQDRTNYGGSGSIGTWGNIIWPTHSGSGHVTYRANIQIKDIDITSGGTVGSNIGIEIQNLDSANSNSAITIAQNNGFSIYAPNAGAVQFGGALRVDGTVTHKGTSLFEGNNFLGGPTKVGGYANGTPPQAGLALTVEKNGLPNQGFVDVNSLGVSLGNLGDYRVQFVSAAVSRLTIGNASEGYDLYPYAATQKLGRANNPFSAVVLKDTANGNSYKLQVTNGALVISLA